MAYNLRYFTSFYGTADKRSTADPDLFELRILELDGVDAPEELEASEFPVTINYQNSSDNKLLPLRGSWLDANLLATVDFELENLYTENERNWLVIVSRTGVKKSFTWYLNETPDGEFVDLNLQIEVNGVNVVDTFSNGSGSLTVNEGDTVRAYAYQLVAPLSGITGANLEITGVPTERSTTSLFEIDITFTATENTFIKAYTTYSIINYTAIRSEVFYKSGDGTPVVFTKSYDSVISQVSAQSDADNDTFFDAEGQAFADAYTAYPAIWRGFIIPDGCQEQFYFPPYVVSINAVDGLGLLKNLSWVQNDGNFWIGKMTWIEVIYACLNRVGVPDMDIYTCVNIYPTGVTQGDAIDPFGITFVDAERYLKDDGITPMNCQEVLESVLQEWTACIIQSEGHWWIYRPTEAALSGTLAFRHYVDGLYVDFVSKNIDVVLGGESEGVILAPLYHINTDQLKMIEKPFKTASISYKYGPNSNILDNPNFLGINTSGPGDPIGPRTDVNIPGWTKSGTVSAGISDGTNLILYTNTPVDIANYYENDFPILIPIGYQFRLILSYESIPALSATDMEFALELNDGVDIWYLQSTGVWARTTDTDFVATYFTIRSNQGISNTTFTSTTTPVAGTGTFKVFQPSTPASDIIFSGIEAQIILEDNPVVGEIHTTQQTADYSYASDTINVFNGDGPAQGFLGTIFGADEDTPTTEWIRRGLTESLLANPPEADKAFLRIAVEEIQRLYGSPFVKFEGSIQNYFNPLSRFTINLLEGKFMPVSLSYNLQANICKAVLTRISNTEIAMDYTLEPDYGETTKVTVI